MGIERQPAFFNTVSGSDLERDRQVEEFHCSIDRLAKTAIEKCGAIVKCYKYCGLYVCLRFAGPGLVSQVTDALAHLEVPEPQKPDFTIQIWDTASSGVLVPPPPWRSESQTVRGDIQGFNTARFRTAFSMYEEVLYLLDETTKSGLVWTQNARTLPFYFAGSPIRPILHWLARVKSGHLIHAAGVGTKNGGILLSGRSGSGKSTTTLLSLNHGLDFVGDDYVAVTSEPVPTLNSLYNTIKIERERINQFRNLISKASIGDSPEDQKSTIFFDDSAVSNLKIDMPLRAVVIPKVTGREKTVIVPIPPLQAALAMAPTTIAQLPGAGDDTLDFIRNLTSRVPCFRIDLGVDMQEIPKVISNLIDDVRR